MQCPDRRSDHDPRAVRLKAKPEEPETAHRHEQMGRTVPGITVAARQQLLAALNDENSLRKVQNVRGDSWVGSGFSASPVADGKIYLSNEDGEMLVVEGGAAFKHIATHSMGETLMATPAISEGATYVRGASTLFAIGR
jgi:hypothetical protein